MRVESSLKAIQNGMFGNVQLARASHIVCWTVAAVACRGNLKHGDDPGVILFLLAIAAASVGVAVAFVCHCHVGVVVVVVVAAER